MASSVKALQWLSFIHVVLAILAITIGIASMNVTDFYGGAFGMGIWLGGWILLTGVAGMASAAKPRKHCRLGVFVGCCLVAIVMLLICSIIIGTVVLKHFRFESTVTRDYYKDKGTFGQQSHENYYKPEEYFQERNRAGRVGLAVYGSLMVVMGCDVLLSTASVFLCRDLNLTHGQASNRRSTNRRAASTRRSQANAAAVPIAGQNWAELVFQGMPIQVIQNSNSEFFTPYKLPNYAELYPEGITNLAAETSEYTLESNIPLEPPPAYSPARTPSLTQRSSLPGSPFVVPLNLHSTPVVERTVVEDSSSTTPSTPLADHTRSPETCDGSNDSSQHPPAIENSSECLESSTAVESLHPEDLESGRHVSLTPSSLDTGGRATVTSLSQVTLPNALTPHKESSDLVNQNCTESNLSGSLPNTVHENTFEDVRGSASVHAPQHETTNFERASATMTPANAPETT